MEVGVGSAVHHVLLQKLHKTSLYAVSQVFNGINAQRLHLSCTCLLLQINRIASVFLILVPHLILPYVIINCYSFNYKDRMQSSWTRLFTPCQYFVEVRWRSLFRSTSLGKRCTSYSAPPTSRKRAADRWSLRNSLPRSSLFMVGKAQKSHGAILELNWILCSAWKKWMGGTPLEHPPYSPVLAPCNFWAFPIIKRELRGKEFRSDQRSTAHFREVGGALKEVHRLPREVLRKRESPHLHKILTWSNKVSPRTFQRLSYIKVHVSI
jgi:hypothetical protein